MLGHILLGLRVIHTGRLAIFCGLLHVLLQLLELWTWRNCAKHAFYFRSAVCQVGLEKFVYGGESASDENQCRGSNPALETECGALHFKTQYHNGAQVKKKISGPIYAKRQRMKQRPGQPKKGKDKLQNYLTRLHPEQVKALDEAAAQMEVSRGAVIRGLIEFFLQNEKKISGKIELIVP